MTDNEDWPITGVVVVADITKCPAGYTTIDRTYDRAEEADLWRDGIFGRRVTRYLCVQRTAPQPGKDVLVDVSIINDRDPVPAGFTVLDYTADTREKSTKKKVICVRWMSVNLTNSALSELIILPKGTRRPPNGYTLVGELNNLMLCYKMANIKTQSSVAHTNSDSALNMSDMANNLPYSLNPGKENAYRQGMSSSYTPGTNLPGSNHPAPLERSLSLSASNNYPLAGVPWQLSPKLTDLENLKNIHIPEIRYKTMMDIENQYQYHFDVERAASANSG
ncbi:multivesicular body subunit 12B-like [Mercenaria mercenaria]|uniref:multivesicular body subunit 12B-like n=1 Tax=Mercenaria mercenaria TaxID=6596 RepID=UPI00234EF15F|nr:multivesicular body subunit 12B-like [Mercenaria mercenaria]XP_045194823.2 multivesicular body subunit 12B-like [Mercenaria mercenaria]